MASSAAAKANASASAPPLPSHEEVLSFWFGESWREAVRDPLAWPAEAGKKWFYGGAAVDEEVRARFLPLIEAFSGGGGQQQEPQTDANPTSSTTSSSCCTRWLEDDLAAAAAAHSSDGDFLPLRALAGVVAMDQLSRHAHRGMARAFALDGRALAWSRALLRGPVPSPDGGGGGGGAGLYRRLAPAARLFALLPFEHSEDPGTQAEGVALFEEMAADARAAAAAAPNAEGSVDGDANASAARLLVDNTSRCLESARQHRDAIERWGRFPGRNAALGRESTAEEAEGLSSGAIARW